MNRFPKLNWIRRWIPGLTRIDWACCILSALLLVSVFPPFELWFLLHWLALVPVLLRIRPHDGWHAFSMAWLTGFLYHIMLLYWLYMVTLPGMVLLCVYISIWFALPFVIVSWLGPRVWMPLAFAGAWFLQEQIRAFGWLSFRWGYLGHGSYDAVLLRQVVEYTGIEGLSFVVALANIAIAGSVCYYSQNSSLAKSIRFDHWIPQWTVACHILVFTFLGISSYHGLVIYKDSIPNSDVSTLDRVALIQGGWPPGNQENASFDEVLDIYLGYSEEAVENPDVELIVWPESTITVPLNHWSEGLKRIRDFITTHDVSILMGCVHGEYHGKDTWDFYNRAWFFTPENVQQEPFVLESIPYYDKMHLVPYGEWIPLGEYWPFYYIETLIEEAGAGIFERGTGVRLFSLPDSGLRFAVAICFESTLSWHAMEAKRLGADFLVVITNDAWFEHSPGLAQHFLQSRFRATEARLPIVRVSNVGITGVISPNGETDGLPIPANQPGTFVGTITSLHE